MTQEEFFKRFTYSVSRDRIGGGGFGTVYKAYDNVLHREVAIKVSEVKTTTDGKKTFSLKDEFEALNHVPKHPNIANYEEFYSYEDHRGVCDYAIMQYYPDGNLSNAIKQGLTAEQKEDIATQLLEGIDFLHKHKVVHRDLKPGNILMVKHGGKMIPLITDFGLSKAAGVADGSVFSNSFGAGTPKYSSPEQLQGQPLRFNTDLWSYGAILYELFTGEQLFTASSGAANTAQADMEVYNKIVNGNVSGLNKMPEKWRRVAERCLVVDATKRAKDAAELFGLIRGDDDETEITVGPSIPSTGSGTTSSGITGSGTTKSGTTRSGTDGSGISTPSFKEESGLTPPSKGAEGIKKDPPKPESKKFLWIGIAAAAVVALIVLLAKPKKTNDMDGPIVVEEPKREVEAVYGFYYGVRSSYDEEPKLNERNLMNALIMNDDRLLINGQVSDVESFHDEVKNFVTPNPNDPTAPEVEVKAIPLLGNVMMSKGVVCFRIDKETSRSVSESVIGEIAKAYNELREEMAHRYYNKQLIELDNQQYEAIREATPVRVCGVGEYLIYGVEVVADDVYTDNLDINNSFVERCMNCLSKNKGISDLIDDFEMQTSFSPLSVDYGKDYSQLSLDWVDDEIADQEISQIVEEMPSFPGGEQKMMEYIAKNTKYPKAAREAGIQGRVFVGFVVEPDGSISNVKLLRGIGGGCDEEAMRVVKSMPKWKPGKQRGKVARVAYQLAVNFKL